MVERIQKIEAPEPACVAAWERIREFVTRPLVAEENRLLREHLEVCADCRMRYDTAVQTAAVLGRRQRLRRIERKRVARRERHRRLAMQAGPAEAATRRQSLFRLRTLLIPAFFAFLMMNVVRLADFGPPPPVVNAEWVKGEVLAADHALGPDERPQAYLHAGEWCVTGEESGALLSGADTRCAVGPDTRVRVESTAPARFRLEEGRLAFDGPGTVSSPYGVLELLEGRVELEAREGRLKLSCLTGRARFTDADGERELGAGERLEVER